MNCVYKGLGWTAASLYEPLKAKNGHSNEPNPTSLILARLVASGKLTGRESLIAFKAERENNPVCFGSYSEWEPCPATKRKEWKPECKMCKKLYHLRGDES